MLQTQIENDMREAMKNKDRKVSILKYMVAEFQRRPNLNKMLEDKEVIALIRKYIKGVEETATLRGGFTEEQTFEIEALSAYLPKMATDEEVKAWIVDNLTLPENPQARMKLMREIMAHFGSTVEGNAVKRILMVM